MRHAQIIPFDETWLNAKNLDFRTARQQQGASDTTARIRAAEGMSLAWNDNQFNVKYN
jgi:hypothetical protein